MAEHHHHHHHNHEHEHGPNCSHEEEHHHHHHDHHHEHEHEHGPNCSHDEEEEHDHHHEHEHHCCDHDHDDAEYFDYDDDDVEYEFEEGYLKQLRDQLPPEIKQLSLEEQDAYIQKSFKDFYKRRREQALMMQQHALYKKEVSENYKHKHPDLLTLKPSFFNPTFWSALQDKVFPIQNYTSNFRSSLRSLLKEEYPHLYTFDMLTPEYCSKLLEEIENFESWCKNTEISIFRPNSMNNYGAILDDFGFYPIFQEWAKKLVAPIAEVLFPEFLGNGFDDHHAFVVEYKMGKDEKLDFHVDDSEVTINVCLGKQFTGGGLFFRGVRCAQHQQDEATKSEEYEFQHTPGKACVHVGRHRHGAHKITSGERFNLILWCRSSSFRHSNLFHGHFPLCGHNE